MQPDAGDDIVEYSTKTHPQITAKQDTDRNRSSKTDKSVKYRNELTQIFDTNDIVENYQHTLDLVELWADQNAIEAYTWMEQQYGSDKIGDLKIRIIEIMIEQSPEIAGSKILELTHPSEIARLAKRYSHFLAWETPNLVLEWSRNIAEDDIRQEVQSIAFKNMLDHAPGDVLNAVNNFPQLDNQVKNELVRTAANLISVKSPYLLADSLFQYDESMQPMIAYSVAANLSRHDREQARSWVQSIPSGYTKYKAIEAYINNAGNQDIEIALELAESVEDNDYRSRLMKLL